MVLSNGTHKGFGSDSTLYKIEAEHYNGDFHTGSILDIIPKGAPFANASTYMVPLTSGFNELSTVQDQKKLIDLDYSPTIIMGSNGEVYAAIRTSGRLDMYKIEDLLEFGRVDYPEHNADNIRNWLAMKDLIEYVKQPAKNGILIEFEEETTPYSEFSAMPDVNKFIKPYIVLDPEDVTREGKIRINDFGKLLSANANTDRDIRDFLFINDIKEGPNYDTQSGKHTYIKESALNWVRSLFSKYIDKVREVQGIGSGDLSDKPAEAATIYRAFLVLANNLHQIAWEKAEALGLRGREAREFVAMYIQSDLEHELIHFLEPDELSERASETRAGELQSEHYSEQAELRKGTVEGRIDSILSRIYAAYAKNAGNGKSGKSKLSKLETLAKEYEAKARSSDMKEEDIADYVEGKLEAYAEKEIEGTDCEETAEGDLEAKTAEGSEVEAETDADSGEGE